jgi:hypothetical protein
MRDDAGTLLHDRHTSTLQWHHTRAQGGQDKSDSGLFDAAPQGTGGLTPPQRRKGPRQTKEAVWHLLHHQTGGSVSPR